MASELIQKAVPKRILDSLKAHIRQTSEKGETGWRSAQQTEDTLTGHWGGAIQIGWSKLTEDSGYFWRWRIDYRKFGSGNQRSSEEKPTGADGIFQIEVEKSKVSVHPSSPSTVSLENVEAEYVFRKGLLFQAKRIDATERERLIKQLKVIEGLTPGDGAYFEYGPDQYRAASAEHIVAVDGFTKKLEQAEFSRLGDFLADKFLACKVGVEGLYVEFDAQPHELYFPKQTSEVNRVQLEIGHGLRVKVAAFKMEPFNRE